MDNQPESQKPSTLTILPKGTLEPEQADIDSYENISKQCLKIFLNRRIKYGNHLDNAKRFKKEDEAGLYLKCARYIRDFENGEELGDDTLIDMANYSMMILSSRKENI